MNSITVYFLNILFTRQQLKILQKILTSTNHCCHFFQFLFNKKYLKMSLKKTSLKNNYFLLKWYKRQNHTKFVLCYMYVYTFPSISQCLHVHVPKICLLYCFTYIYILLSMFSITRLFWSHITLELTILFLSVIQQRGLLLFIWGIIAINMSNIKTATA